MSDLVDIRDELDVVAHLYDAANMAAETLQAGEKKPICAVLNQAAHKLFAVREQLGALVESRNSQAALDEDRDVKGVERFTSAATVPATIGEPFGQRFAAWLAARAEVARHGLQPAEKGGAAAQRYERHHAALMQAVDDTARLAATTLATRPQMVWHKFEILEEALYGAGEEANYTDRRHVWIVAGIKADLLTLGFTDTAEHRGAGSEVRS